MTKQMASFGFLFLVLLAATGWCGEKAKSPQAMLRMPATTPPPFRTVDSDTIIWQSYDDSSALYYFPLPDQWDDHYFNVRFTAPAPDSCRLLKAALMFRRVPGDSTSISRDIHVVIFKGSSTNQLLPVSPPDSGALDSVKVQGTDVLVYPETTYVDLSNLNLTFAPGTRFHIAWEPDMTDTSDSSQGVRALLGDDGIPYTTYSSEWWGGTHNAWGTIADDWGHSTNFLLRAQIQTFGAAEGVPIWINPGGPATFALYGAYPNPFNPSTTLSYQLATAGQVSLRVYDTSGRLVATLVDGRQQPGVHQVSFDGTHLPSGLYLYRLVAGQNTAAGKMVLLK